MAGIARGKIVPAERFLKAMESHGLRIPEQIFVQTVTGHYPEEDTVCDPASKDVYLSPDPDHDPDRALVRRADRADHLRRLLLRGAPVEFALRNLLRRVLALYAKKGWRPIVAPELEFFLVDVNTDPDYPLEPPIGRSGRRETSRQSYGVDAVNEFDPIFEDVYDFCEAQGIDIDTLTHEAGSAQMEMNFNHGDALELADQTFLFKRTVREAGLRHKVYATFMAKPMQNEPGSSMHIHQSLLNAKTGRNLFAQASGKNSSCSCTTSAACRNTCRPDAPSGPNVNSYRRLMPDSDAPINVHWGNDNRTVGLRVPQSEPATRGGWRTASPGPTPIPTWRSRPPWPAATWA